MGNFRMRFVFVEKKPGDRRWKREGRRARVSDCFFHRESLRERTDEQTKKKRDGKKKALKSCKRQMTQTYKISFFFSSLQIE